MPTWQRAYFIACAAVIGWCLAYVLSDFAGWPSLTYFQYERAWRLVEGRPGFLPSNYVGTVLWGVGGAVVAGLLTWLGSRFVRRELPRRHLMLAGAWALTAFAMGGLYFTWNLWPF